MADMSVNVLVRLRDRLSSGLNRLSGRLNALGRSARNLGAIGALAATLTFAGPAAEAAAFDQVLRDSAVTAGLATEQVNDYIAANGRLYEQLALATGQASASVAGAAGNLQAAGMDAALIDQLLAPISRVATAASAEIDDIGRVAFALSDTLKVPAAQMEDALGMLVVAGKEGRFELREMAKYFPALTAQMAKLGVDGTDAVAVLASGLQIAMKGASDPAQAANNFNNFLSKILSKETIDKFAKAGTDLPALMMDAVAKGINPVEAVLANIQDITGVGGDQIAGYMADAEKMGLKGADALAHVQEQLEKIGAAETLSALFGDQQVLGFLIPMMANIEEYKRIRDAVLAGDRSVIDQDLATQMEGPTRQRAIFFEILAQQGRDVGDAFNSWLPAVNGFMLDMIGHINVLEERFPGAKAKILSFATAGMVLAAALGTIGVVLPFITAGFGLVTAAGGLTLSPLIAVTRYFVTAAKGAIGLQAALAIMEGKRFTFLARLAVGLRGIAMAVPGVAALANPLGAVIAAMLAVGATAIWLRNQDWYKSYAEGSRQMGADIRASLIDAKSAYDEWATNVGASMRDWPANITETMSGVAANFAVVWDDAKAGLGTLSDIEIDWSGLFDGLEAAWNDAVAWFVNLPDRIMAAVGSIDLSSLLTWPEAPAWMKRWLGRGAGETDDTVDPQGQARDNRGRPVDRFGPPVITVPQAPSIALDLPVTPSGKPNVMPVLNAPALPSGEKEGAAFGDTASSRIAGDAPVSGNAMGQGVVSVLQSAAPAIGAAIGNEALGRINQASVTVNVPQAPTAARKARRAAPPDTGRAVGAP